MLNNFNLLHAKNFAAGASNGASNGNGGGGVEEEADMLGARLKAPLPEIAEADSSNLILPLKDDPKYAKYFKMLKIGMPLTHVKHAMERDGLNSAVMDQDHSMPATSSLPRKVTRDTRKKKKQSLRRARLHWNTLSQFVTESIWGEISDDETLGSIDIDEDEFNDLFQAEAAVSQKPKARIATKKKGAAVRVIDPKRANNGGIVLARVKMSPDEMARSVDRMDSGSLTAGQIENIIEYLPTKEERSKLENYMEEKGDEEANDPAERFQGLCECEKFMVSMMTVKHPNQKLDALHFQVDFQGCLDSIIKDADVIDQACDELRKSNRLRTLLGIVLEFGNRLNTAGQGTQGKAEAFTLDSLLKLKQTKAFDKKTTFLHYIALIVQRNDETLLNFADDIQTVIKAERVHWNQCLSALDNMETQLENVRRMALHEAHKKKHANIDDDNGILDDIDIDDDIAMTLEEEMEALKSTQTGIFTLHAIKQLCDLYHKVDITMVKFHNLLEYFGEDSVAKRKPHELFAIFSQFSRDLEQAKPKGKKR